MSEDERHRIVKSRVGISSLSKNKLWFERQCSNQWGKGVTSDGASEKAGARVNPNKGNHKPNGRIVRRLTEMRGGEIIEPTDLPTKEPDKEPE